MKVPPSITLGPHLYEIRCDTDTARLLRDEESKGDSRPDHLLIRLDTDRPHTGLAETLLHEALHCVWHQTSLSVDHGEAEEQIVTALAPLVLQLLRANPDLVTFLMGEGK